VPQAETLKVPVNLSSVKPIGVMQIVLTMMAGSQISRSHAEQGGGGFFRVC
jgi:hypothetical protein